MDLPEAVRYGISLFNRHSEEEDQQIITELVEAGVSRPSAEQIVLFIPMAFSRMVLRGSGIVFPRTYLAVNRGRASTERVLAEEPTYVEALLCAQGAPDQKTLLSIACRSSEFKALNSALQQGKKPEDLKCLPPMISEELVLPPASKGKRWWQFWKAFHRTDMPPKGESSRPLESSVYLEPESRLLMTMLKAVLSKQGLKTHEEKSALVLDRAGLTFETTVHLTSAPPGPYNVHIDIGFSSARLDGRQLRESCSAVASNIGLALTDGLEKLNQGSIHPVLAVLVHEKFGEKQIRWESWEAPAGQWRACRGPLVAGFARPSEEFCAAFEGAVGEIKKKWLATGPAPKMHWLRVFAMASPSGPMVVEALLDNEIWEDGLSVLKSCKWPGLAQKTSLRSFLVLIPVH